MRNTRPRWGHLGALWTGADGWGMARCCERKGKETEDEEKQRKRESKRRGEIQYILDPPGTCPWLPVCRGVARLDLGTPASRLL